MPQPDFRGARGSNAGDDFHELWALRQALSLLDPETQLVGITVEGLRGEDENGSPSATWEGVDCGLYFNGATAAAAKRIDIVQFKYSSASPDAKWTVARLVNSTAKKGNNSILRRMSVAFEAVRKMRNGSADGVQAHLISNQPVDPHVAELFATVAAGTDGNAQLQDETKLKTASGLAQDDFRRFAQAVELSQTGSRFSLDNEILRTIAGWTEGEARTILNSLLRFMRQMMMPESKGQWITRETLLSQLNFSDARALFPCPSQLHKVAKLIPRETSSRVVAEMLKGHKYICLHGLGGCGKTTALEEIRTLLPTGSAMLVFDCYGGGRYLDSDAYRHRSKDAFLQLSNELAVQLRVPLLLTRSDGADYARAFHGRLIKAAEAVNLSAPGAILAIAVDAADNSVTAAHRMVPLERSFVQDFVTLGDLPDNVRLLVTARSGRLNQLGLTHNFKQLVIEGFTRDETAAHILPVWDAAPAGWIDDFHHFSRGNPRVQHYALGRTNDQPRGALSLLLPGGKALNDVFQIQLDEARKKSGRDEPIDNFSAALSVLPHPVPLPELSAISGMTESELSDICADLAPGIRVTSNGVGFADEDFEDFIRTNSARGLEPVRARVADRFTQRRHVDQYAAMHLAPALHAAGRGKEILELIEREAQASAIVDPILRREVGFQRLQVAMQVSSESNDQSFMLRTILVGAEAMRGDEAVFELITKHPDLAAAFMRGSAVRTLLLDARQISQHGRLLFHIILEDARVGNAIGARETHRQLQAWLQRRRIELEKGKKVRGRRAAEDWSITADDIASEVEAALLIAGPGAAITTLKGWSPRELNLKVVRIVVQRLISSGRAALVERFLSENLVRAPWSLFLLVPLALAGRKIELKLLQHGLRQIHRRGWIRLDKMGNSWENTFPSLWLDTILTGCEIFIGRGGDRKLVVPLLEIMSDKRCRNIDILHPFQHSLIDIQLRAVALLARCEGRALAIDEFLIIPPEQKDDSQANARSTGFQHREEIRAFVRPLISLYDLRAHFLSGAPIPEEFEQLVAALGKQSLDDYSFSRIHGASEMRRSAATAVAYLRCLSSIDPSTLLACSLSIFGQKRDAFGTDELAVLPHFASDVSLHSEVLAVAASRIGEIVKVRTVASDKIEALLKLCGFVGNINRDEAAAIFGEAHKLSEEIDVEAVHQLRAVASMAIRAAPAMAADKRRQACQRLYSIATDAAIRLSDHDGFPWAYVVEGLVQLDLPTAFASVSRWQDSDLKDLDATLPTLLQVVVNGRLMSSKTVVALLPLVHLSTGDLLETLPVDLSELPSGEREVVVEELARDELLRFGTAYYPPVLNRLRQCRSSDGPAGPWLRSLEETAAFLGRDATSKNPKQRSDRKSAIVIAESLITPFAGGIRFIAPEEIVATVKSEMAAARSSKQFTSVTDILERIRITVAAADRVAHLNALAVIQSDAISEYSIADAVRAAIEDKEWRQMASIRHWCSTRLAGVIVELFPGFAHGFGYGGHSPLTPLLARLAADGKDIPLLLAKGIGAHVEELSARVVYELVRLIAEQMQPSHTAEALGRHLERMNDRIPPTDLDQIPTATVPADNSEAVARFLYSLMSDCDVRLRWRAAHSVRRLAVFGLAPLDKFVNLFDRTSEEPFRAANEPFCWLAARLWYVIAMNRIAYETPSAIASHFPRLVSIATDESFPHVLIRAFAKDAALRLLDSGHAKLNAKDRRTLVKANTDKVPRRGRDRNHSRLQPAQKQKSRERAFDFDHLDTVPYWYGPAIDVFSDVSMEQFLDAAEGWIVGKWKTASMSSRWKNQPRQSRFSERNWHENSNDHGGEPTLEPFSIYLERHAMFCAVGQLMQTRALVQRADDEYDALEGWLKRKGFCSPPLWLADLRGPKPLEKRLWFEPGSIASWINTPSDAEFLEELGINGSSEQMIIAHAWHQTGSSRFSSTVMVNSSLVEPTTAASLMRALQSVDDPYGYKLPDEDESFEIAEAPYRLIGWLAAADWESGMDRKDPLRRTISGVRVRPGTQAATRLVQGVSCQGAVTWQTAEGSVEFEYAAWSDKRDDERADSRRHSLESEGHRLRVSTEALAERMRQTKMDTIVSVKFIREEGDGGYQEDDTKRKKAHGAKVFILRQDGSIEDCNGRIGAWQEPRNRAQNRRQPRHARAMVGSSRR